MSAGLTKKKAGIENNKDTVSPKRKKPLGLYSFRNHTDEYNTGGIRPARYLFSYTQLQYTTLPRNFP